MISPFSFFIFVMSSLFFAVLIPGIFRIPLNSSRILSMYRCLFILFLSCIFYAFAQVLQSLFLFFGHASPLLDESQDFSIFIKELFILFCCCRRGHLCFFVVEHARGTLTALEKMPQRKHQRCGNDDSAPIEVAVANTPSVRQSASSRSHNTSSKYCS